MQHHIHQSWYADDNSAADQLAPLQEHLDTLERVGLGYDYHSNTRKIILLTKAQHLEKAQKVFVDTGIVTTSEGARYLGRALGSEGYKCFRVPTKCDQRAKELRSLARVAKTQTHAVYTLLTKSLVSGWRYHLRCTMCPGDLLGHCDDIIA